MTEAEKKLGFDITPTDKVIYSRYDPETGLWGPLLIKDWSDHLFYASPMSTGLNYARSVFEGLKAYQHENGKISLFRPEENAERFRNSMRGLYMPPFPEKDFLRAVKLLVQLNAKYVPAYREGALYIRPIVWGGDKLGYGNDPGITFTVCFWCSPVGNFYSEGLQSITLWVARGITRAMPGGVGYCKAAGNYEISLKAREMAMEEGCKDALYLDGKTETFIEELGGANVFVVKDNVLCTPPIGDIILPGITRKSLIVLAQELGLGLKVEERDISVAELKECQEIFACGTAAIVTSIGQIKDRGQFYTIGNGQAGPITKRLYEFLTGIQYGNVPDKHNWLVSIYS